MKKAIITLLIFIPQLVFAETWVWNTKITKIRSFNGSRYICFGAERIDRAQICFDSSVTGGKERLSILLAAKMAQAPVDVSYREPSTGESILWFNDSQFYWNNHLWVR